MSAKITQLLGDSAQSLLEHKAIVPKERLHLPGPDFVDRIWAASDRPIPVLRSLQQIFGTGRLAGSGYVPPSAAPTAIRMLMKAGNEMPKALR